MDRIRNIIFTPWQGPCSNIIFIPLATYGNFWTILATLGKFYRMFATLGKFLANVRNIWQMLASFGNFYKMLAIYGNFWGSVICHMMIIKHAKLLSLVHIP